MNYFETKEYKNAVAIIKKQMGMTWRSSMAMRPEPSAREAVT